MNIIQNIMVVTDNDFQEEHHKDYILKQVVWVCNNHISVNQEADDIVQDHVKMVAYTIINIDKYSLNHHIVVVLNLLNLVTIVVVVVVNYIFIMVVQLNYFVLYFSYNFVINGTFYNL